MNIHPVAKLFPMLSASDLNSMADSIRKQGLLNACVCQGDTLLDGRNRLAACKLAGVEPRFIEYEGDDASTFIISQNIHRRHLDESQRAMVAARLATLKDGQHGAASIEAAKSQPEAASMLNVGRSSVQRARVVLDHGIPELVKAVDDGRIAVSDASKIAGKDSETQRAVVQKTITGEITVGQAMREIAAQKDRQQMEQAAKAIAADKEKSLLEVCDVRHCSCAELFASGIKPDAVITDPPYPEKFLPVFS